MEGKFYDNVCLSIKTWEIKTTVEIYEENFFWILSCCFMAENLLNFEWCSWMNLFKFDSNQWNNLCLIFEVTYMFPLLTFPLFGKFRNRGENNWNFSSFSNPLENSRIPLISIEFPEFFYGILKIIPKKFQRIPKNSKVQSQQLFSTRPKRAVDSRRPRAPNLNFDSWKKQPP